MVCAGAKSILDIGKTVEYLESQGVAVCGYRCDEFPAFYARTSGHKLDHRFDGARDLARMIRLQREIGPGGVLIANPIPEAHALDADAIEKRIGEAVLEARAKGIEKKDVTPFLLGRIVETDAKGAAWRPTWRWRATTRRWRPRSPSSWRSSDMPRALVVGDVMTDIRRAARRAVRARARTRRRASSSGRAGRRRRFAVWLARAGVEVDFVARVGAADVERIAAEFRAAGRDAVARRRSRRCRRGGWSRSSSPRASARSSPTAAPTTRWRSPTFPRRRWSRADWLHLSGYTLPASAARARRCAT